eukprot:1259164-Alexandrium_andersonii.AAC.1
MCIRDSPTRGMRTDPITLHTDHVARRRRPTEPGNAERLSSRHRSLMGKEANGRTVDAGGPR